MDRIEKLREKALISEGWDPAEFFCLFYKEYVRLSAETEAERYSESFYYAFENMTPNIDYGELIVGKCAVNLDEKLKSEWDETYKSVASTFSQKAGRGQDSHMAIDYDLLLDKGIVGILSDIEKLSENCDTEKLTFYNTCKTCLKAVARLSEKYSETALEMSRQTDDIKTRNELEKVSEICKKVPLYPAETFHEAVQCVHFISHCLSLNPYRFNIQQFQLGRPDRYLLRFYENDIKNSVITKEDAQLLLDCLGLQINMRVHSGASSGYMVGGRDEDGNLIQNDLTEMCMQVIEDIRLVYPAVGLCYTDSMDEKYLDKACELLLKGHSHPAIFNDDVISKGLVYYGIPEKDAHNYIHSTCVEITPVASSNVWVATPYTNLPQILLDNMNDEHETFDDLFKAVLDGLSRIIRINYETAVEKRIYRAKNSRNPLLSCFVNDCLEKGLDIEKGGARYNWIMPSFVGMANLVDSLYSIKKLVFDEKKLSLSDFKNILDDNFKNSEDLMRYITDKIEKYGNNVDDIDNYFGIITDFISDECEKYFDEEQSIKLIPSVFCWIMHECFGRETSATPDGRKKSFPLGDGSGPAQGREMKGPTASIISSTKWDHYKFIGGVAVNLKFSKASLGNNSSDVLKSLIRVYLKRGGFELQINVLDNETLRKAQLSPDEYKDLIVRIGGYSDYFVRLSKEMQEELILRTAHKA